MISERERIGMGYLILMDEKRPASYGLTGYSLSTIVRPVAAASFTASVA